MAEQTAETATVLGYLLGFIAVEVFYRVQVVALMVQDRLRRRSVDKLLDGYLIG